MRSIFLSFLFLMIAALTFKVKPASSDEKEPIASFRIIFGIKDTIPTAWNGSIVTQESQVISIEADRFRNHQYDAKGWSPQGIITIKLGDPVFPNDYLVDSLSWICSTRNSPMHGPTTEWHDHGQINNLHGHKLIPEIQQPSIIVNLLSNTFHQPIIVKTIKGEFSFVPNDVLHGKTNLFINNNIRVEVVPRVKSISKGREGQQDFPSITTAVNGDVWTAWQEYDNKDSDLLLVRRHSNGKWNDAEVLIDGADIFHTAIAEDSKHRIWVVWSMQVDGRWDLYGKFNDGKIWSETKKITNGRATKNVYHKMISDSNGQLWLVWQATADGFSEIYAKNFNGEQWSADEKISSGIAENGNNWWPSIAAGKNGLIAIAWDGYAGGSYDVYCRVLSNTKWGEVKVIAGTARFEAHPTLAIDQQNRIWIAWNESGNDWGKDTGFLVERKGTQLHESRVIKLVCLVGEKMFTTQEDISEVLSYKQFWELPVLQIDANGNPFLFARKLVMREPDTPLEGPIDLALWEIYGISYTGKKWSKPMYLPHSSGRNDMVPASTLTKEGKIWGIWATDLRDARAFQPYQLNVEYGKFDLVKNDQPMVLKSYEPEMGNPFKKFSTNESEDVKRIQSYKIKHNNKTYSIFRGDLHRHTDISVDGNNDGSLLDAYRYAKDVAKLDFIGIADHTDNIWEKYAWYRSQKVADLFQVKKLFTAFYGYERSVEYPNGHRNIFFAKRSAADILPIGSFEARGYVGSGALYQYLHRFNGFSIPHTTGRTSGTDWRENDQEVEPLVELFQGSRDSYEYPGSPRPFQLFKLPDTTKPVPRASSAPTSPSFRPLGFAWNALAKGYKLGFIASSDHISTHVSYACLIATELSPEGLFDAVKARRAYAATDNIILDITYVGSSGKYLMGDIFDSSKPVEINAKIIGTDEILQVDIVKDGKIVKTYQPNKDMFNLAFKDPSRSQKQSYFYVRVIQKNGEMAWGSPAWVNYKSSL